MFTKKLKFIILMPIFVLFILALYQLPAFAKSSEKPNNFNSKISPEDQAIIDLGYVPDEVIVKFKESKINLKNGSSQVKANSFMDKHASEISRAKKELKFANTVVYKVGDGGGVLTVIEKLKKDPDVETVIPNYVFTFFSGTNDPYYVDDNQWGLNNTTNGKDIQADEAWNISTGGTSKIIAILDTGVSYDHPDLNDNMWDGSSCVDENGSALNDCMHGYDFVNDDKDPADDWGHGTHMAGIIGAEGNNSTGITGVNQTANIMAVKVGNAYGTFSDIIAGIKFAQENGADIINASFGGPYLAWADYSGMHDAIEDFTDTGLFIAAAGNEWNDNDDTGIFPAGFEFDNLIAVTATDDSDDFVEDYDSTYTKWGANWGEETVDLFAPGKDIWSTYMQNQTFTYFDPDADIAKNSPWYDDTISSIDYLLTNSGTYSASTSASVTTTTIDLSGSIEEDSAVIYFDAWCDTETGSDDYVEIFVRKDSGAWSSALPDLNTGETQISEDNLIEPEVRDSYLGAKGKFGAQIPSSYLDNDTEFKFEWTTDGSDTGGPYRGCRFSDIYVSYMADGETGSGGTSYYEAPGATSAAAAFTSGVAALVWNKYPDLTADEVRQIILESGDDVDNVHPTITPNPPQLTVTGKRLNAYRALVMAEQVNAGQSVYLYPTIHSKTTGGSWSSASTWVENRVPNSNDVVEISGNVSLNTNTTIAGLLVDSGKTFQGSSGYITLTVTGDLVNSGTIQNGPYSLSTNITHDLDNSGTMTNPVNLVGAGASHAISSTGTISGTVTVVDNATLTQSVTFDGPLTVNSSRTLTIAEGQALTVKGTLSNNGTVTGGDIILGGASTQTWSGAGTYSVNVIAGGTGTKSLSSNITVGGNMTVNSGVTLQNSGGYRTLTVNGDMMNSGAVQNYSGYSLSVNITHDLENSGTISGPVNLVGAGASHAISSTGTISGTVTVVDNATLTQSVTFDGPLTVNSTKTLTIDGAQTLTVKGTLTNSGTVTGGDIILGGSSPQSWSGGTYSGSVVLGGTGTKSLSSNTTVGGNMTVNSGVTLQNSGGYRTLTVNGDMMNSGTVQNYSGYSLSVNITHDLDNSGTISGPVNLVGAGASHAISSSGTISGTVTVVDNSTLTQSVTFDGPLTVNSSRTLTIAEGQALTVKGTLSNNGTVTGGNIILGGASAQTWSGTGTYSSSVVLGGAGTKSLSSNTTVGGDVTVNSGVTLQPSGSNRTLTITGNLVNNGTVQNYSAYLTVNITNDLENSGTMSNSPINAKWDSVGGASSYDFQVTDTSYNWLDPISTGANTYSSITSYVTQTRKWRWRSVTGGTPSDWSAEHLIN